ncbi:MAG: hypothetical protein ACYS17_05220, partial [Planctomycetota bacterium]
KHALHGGRLEVGRNVYLRNGFRANGEIGLVDATINGNLECNNAKFTNNKKVNDEEPIAINGERLTVKGDIFLCKGHWGNEPKANIKRFKAMGEVKLVGAQIRGTLDCKGGSFIYEKGKAILANSMNVNGNVYLCDGFKAKGEVSLVRAKIEGFFYWMNVQSPNEVRLDLRSARIGILRDEEKSWPTKNELFLYGLVYEEIHNKAPRKAENRIDWLQRQGSFWSQPYEQLTAVFRKSGEDAKVNKILIAKNKDKARLTNLTWSEWLWYNIFGRIIGYGYRPWQVTWICLLIIIPGWIFFWAGYRTNVMTPPKETYINKENGSNYQISQDYSNFNSLIYTLDVFVPLVDLRQANYLLPNANRNGELSISENRYIPVYGKVLYYYFCFEIIAGWVLTALLVAGLTGLVRK